MASSIVYLVKWLSPRFVFSLALLVISSFLSIISSNSEHILSTCSFDAIYQFGDSTSDTGNYIRENPSSRFARLPYGETFFRKPTGRCSNGLLIIDYIAQSTEIPFLAAYSNKEGSFDHGVNFAVAGATALSVEALSKKGLMVSNSNSSLSTQLDWMFSYFNTTCHSVKDCLKKNKRGLFIVGEIGGDDYKYGFLQGKTFEEVKAMVPEVVQTIKYATKRIIGYGATRIVVPGDFPTGCFPVYLTQFQAVNSTAYDEFYCLKEMNNFSNYHNNLLQQAIEELKEEHPNVVIVYGDYYNSFLSLLVEANLHGFDPTSLQKACCGVGGEYNYDFSRPCGDPGVPVCYNPDERISWDGIHLTQKAYKLIATWLIRDIYPQLECKNIGT